MLRPHALLFAGFREILRQIRRGVREICGVPTNNTRSAVKSAQSQSGRRLVIRWTGRYIKAC
jgi:hypothetical protein